MQSAPTAQATSLARVPLFAGLDPTILDTLARTAITRQYARGQVVFLEGEPCAGLFIVAGGGVKVYKLSPQGREQVLHYLGAGDSFNDVAVLDGGANPASVAATVDSTLWVLARSDIKRLAQLHPALAWALIESIARRTRHLVEMVEDLALRSVKSRLAKLLLTQAEGAVNRGAIERHQMVTQSEMAARLGTVREMVGRALRDLADEGVIEIDRHRIVIADQEGLRAIADGW